jgi:hypothetical protein
MSPLLVFNRVYRDTSSHAGIFDSSCEIALLTGSLPPFPVVWGVYTGVIHCVFDQIVNLKNCFSTPNNRGPQIDKHLPPSPSSG